ncbi:MAG: PAS domain-containing protein, partial [bacterium]
LHILMMEHKLLIGIASDFRKITREIGEFYDTSEGEELLKELNNVVSKLEDSASHYLREENVLFPYLEKHGIVGPLKVMWIEHDKIREIKKDVRKHIDSFDKIKFSHFAFSLEKSANELSEIFEVHFNKENSILYEAALRVIDEIEWIEIRKQFDEMGYPAFLPKKSLIELDGQSEITTEHEAEGGIVFDTGDFSGIQLESMLDALPFDVTFIDDEDRVRYFNQPADPIFTRMKAIIGTKVQNCHPSKSVHMVDQILTDFRNGVSKVAEFWIKMGEKYVYIRYFPVRDKQGNYLGCMEVSQDIAPVQKIKGEKRLL